MTDEPPRDGHPGAEATTRMVPVEQAVDRSAWRAANLAAVDAGRQRLVRAVNITLTRLRRAGSPGVGTVVRFSLFLPNWKGWVLREGFFLLTNGDLATTPLDEGFRSRSRHSPEEHARLVLATAWTQYPPGDDHTGIPRDRLDDTPPAKFDLWVEDKFRSTARPLAVLLGRHGLARSAGSAPTPPDPPA